MKFRTVNLFLMGEEVEFYAVLMYKTAGKPQTANLRGAIMYAIFIYYYILQTHELEEKNNNI